MRVLSLRFMSDKAYGQHDLKQDPLSRAMGRLRTWQVHEHDR